MNNLKNYQNRFYTLLEANLGNVRPLINEEDTPKTTEPGDPSQQIDISAELSEISAALQTYNAAFKQITGVDITLFVDNSNVNKITANGLGTNNYLVNLSKGKNMIRISKPGEWRVGQPYNTVQNNYSLSEGDKLGSDPNYGLWRFGTRNLKPNDKKDQKLKQAAAVVGTAIAKYYTSLIAKTQGKPAEVVSTSDGTVKIIG